MQMQQMMQQQMMQQQMMEQQMQQQMMQMQMLQAQQEAEMHNILNKNINTEIIVIFRAHEVGGATDEMVECKLGDEVSKIIERYRRKSGDKDLSKKFIFNARALHPGLTVAEAGLTDNAKIFVVETKGLRGG